MSDERRDGACGAEGMPGVRGLGGDPGEQGAGPGGAGAGVVEGAQVRGVGTPRTREIVCDMIIAACERYREQHGFDPVWLVVGLGVSSLLDGTWLWDRSRLVVDGSLGDEAYVCGRYGREVAFGGQVQYKARWAGSEVCAADAWYASSKTCSACGARNDPGSSETYRCEACGLEMDRDLNAAVNLEGLAREHRDRNAGGEQGPGSELDVVDAR